MSVRYLGYLRHHYTSLPNTQHYNLPCLWDTLVICVTTTPPFPILSTTIYHVCEIPWLFRSPLHLPSQHSALQFTMSVRYLGYFGHHYTSLPNTQHYNLPCLWDTLVICVTTTPPFPTLSTTIYHVCEIPWLFASPLHLPSQYSALQFTMSVRYLGYFGHHYTSLPNTQHYNLPCLWDTLVICVTTTPPFPILSTTIYHVCEVHGGPSTCSFFVESCSRANEVRHIGYVNSHLHTQNTIIVYYSVIIIVYYSVVITGSNNS